MDEKSAPSKDTQPKIKCAICGIREATSRDHIPPKSIFPKPWPNDLITVPACYQCNSGSSPDDEEFKVGISLLAGTETSLTRQLWDKGTMPTLAHNRKLHREIVSGMIDVDVQTPAGIYLRTEKAILIPAKGIKRVVERTIRGLYFHHFKECLGAQAHCGVQKIQVKPTQEVLELIRGLPVVAVAGGVFKYRFGRPSDAPLTSIWLLSFYSVPMIGYTINVDDDWRPY